MKSTAFYYSLGRPFSPIYGLAMRLREKMYARGMFKRYSLSVPVISVGNLTMGGAGKTPVVCYLARKLKRAGYSPSVISRGYGGKANGKVNIVSNGTTLKLSADMAGDEPRMLAELLEDVPVLTGIVRRFPAQRAIEMGANVLLLDDGFQHMAINRDINLVLFNTDWLAGNSRVFPGGDLREPVAALRRASRFVMTGMREDNRERAERFADLLHSKFPEIPLSFLEYGPSSSVSIEQGTGRLVESSYSLKEKSWYAFAGIAQPQSFHTSLEEYGVAIAGFKGFADHQVYTKEILDQLNQEAEKSGAAGLVTTEKDLVKLAAVAESTTLPLLALRMEVRERGDFLNNILKELQCSSS